MNNALKYIEIFTDGACRGNPGVGGWGAILIYKDHKDLDCLEKKFLLSIMFVCHNYIQTIHL